MDSCKADYTAIPALPADYAGVTFRSRLEARWAHYFDLIGIPWQYEPEGFSLAAGNYCPDFRCFGFYVEVKPTELDRTAHATKLAELSKVTGAEVFCVVGDPSLDPQKCWKDGREYGSGVFSNYAFQEKGWDFPNLTPGHEGIHDAALADRARKIRFSRSGFAEVDWEAIQARNTVIRQRHKAFEKLRGLEGEARAEFWNLELKPLDKKLDSLNRITGL